MGNVSTLLQRRPCIVTGGGTGIGRGIALALASRGAEVVITGRRRSALEETAAIIRDAGGNVHICEMDVTDQAAVTEAFVQLDDEMNLQDRLHLVVNNAGVGGSNACALEGPENWDVVIRTNLDGVFLCTREAVKRMRDGGRVINISSVLGKFGVPGFTAYCASKHGVIGFTKALALEVAPRQITVNAICPGWVDTEMARNGIQGLADATGTSYDYAFASAMSEVPLGRILKPKEIGELVVYLASEAASGVTGQAISICGGQTMG